MKTTSPSSHRVAFVRQQILPLSVIALLAAGCPSGKPNSDGAGTSTASPNTIVIRGSNTIGEELAPRLISEFKKKVPVVKFDLETKATGYGMAALRVGQCDLAAASRPAISADLELAKEANVEMNDHAIGAYSVGIVVHPSNPVTGLTTNQVRDIFNGKIQNWKDVGGADAVIHLYVRDPISGTHLGFKEIAMGNDEYAHHPKLLTTYQGILDAVAADANGIGYSGFRTKPDERIKQLPVSGVELTAASVHSGKYPYVRTLRFYTNKARESEATKKFLAFVQSADGQAILTEMGFVPKS
jgi:phosphate transport system substrate-binding protein